MNKAILQMKSLTEVENCDSRAWCQAEPHISNKINGGVWFYNQPFNPDMHNSTMNLGSLNLNKLAYIRTGSVHNYFFSYFNQLLLSYQLVRLE